MVYRSHILHLQNKAIYSKQCIEKELVKFIEDYHADGNYLFWPDLASAHYAKWTLDTFTRLHINYVSKDCNPPVVPELRPIEDFWGMLKQLVYAHNWEAADHDHLKHRIKYCLKKVDNAAVSKMMREVHLNVGRAMRNGTKSVLH